MLSRKNVTRAAVGLAVAAGTLLLAAGPAMANDSSDGPKGAGGSGSDFSDDGGPSPANDVTPGGVPIFGVLSAVEGAPARIVPGGSGPGY
jgi:hypothetical protein